MSVHPIFDLGDAAPGPARALAAGVRGHEERSGNRKAVGSVTYVSNLDAGDTVTIEGVVLTAVASGATTGQFNVAGTLTLTLDAIVTAAMANATIAATCVVTKSGTTILLVTAAAYGIAGNDITLAASVGTVVEPVTGTSDRAISGNANLVNLVTSAGAVEAFTLPNGAEGQEITLYFKTKGSGANAAVAGVFTSATLATFDAAGDYISFKWMGGAWRTMLNSSVTLS